MVSARHVGGAIPPQGYLVRQSILGGGEQGMVSARHVGGAIPPQGYLVCQNIGGGGGGGGGESMVWCLLDMSVEQYHHRATWYVRILGGGARTYLVCSL